MNYTRRAFGAGVLAGLAGTAGCLGFVRGEDALAFEAVGVRPSDGTLAETGYRHTSTETEPLSETIEIGNTTRELELENVVVECDRGVDLGVLGTVRAATFIAFAAPQFEVLGRTFHPGERVDPRRIATELGSNYDDLSIGEEVAQWELTVFDETADVSTFEGRAAVGGTELDVHAHVGTATNDEDFVIFVGAHPRRLKGERTRVATLAESLAPLE
ncbi:hypothetical protein HAPAU_19150 [Halalkalicoccus paucihalophilus]|uniref:Uncharacterized protein n=1 Tax=Halalkalicoccus paucihalophilus TaxID=1008153 RepID=A0A151AH97_9EURY|nr:DUF6517 family protein [Halalkalicoccus paucihalophilus]KYH26807.1 hypothetical protein HAPAU_19150 [Halalkalicoccus paucihalophilus]